MKKQAHLKNYIHTNPMQVVNQLGAEMIIEDALKNQRKNELKALIDEALIHKNEQEFNMYTEEYIQLEVQNVG
ncbi:IDEAL domain-containing protein [Staphylococcus canis]|uniref:IDEAL domain-containing protein n=1 Tax=Staphylococcus canis TaxID=2724942 RepID=A0ABS0TBA9_9STAP|nr:IDEAL domain-containing protein [Staphylococcus canis]MBI5975246.1 IDEAL domain-containing protein [Staphylococcus canis]